MARIVPSQVIAYISQMIPEPTWDNLGPGQAGELAGLLSLIDKIPEELLSMDSASYSDFIQAVSSIREQFKIWDSGRNPPLNLTKGRGARMNAVACVRESLSKCPDEAPAPATTELAFITETDLRQSLRIDIGAVYRAIGDGEWKGATVIAGSVIEALLLWALDLRKKQQPHEVESAIVALTGSNTLRQKPKAALEEWNLHEYIEVAAHLSIITAHAAAQARIAKDFRNLIHPGRAQRLAQKCDRGTAYSAVAGVESVIRDLT